MSLRDALSTPEGKSVYTRRLFATIADRYDLITAVLSGGLDRRWKRRVIRLASPLQGRAVLDLACGTGDLAFLAADAGADVTALDITPRMIALARVRAAARTPPAPRFLVGDMMALPFPDRSFDLVTTGYGLRNVPVLAGAIEEVGRVLRPGGRLLSLDFNRPGQPIVRAAYHVWLTAAGGTLGWLLHGDPDTYRYIPETIRRYPGAPAVAELLRAAGFVEVRWLRVLGGLLAIHDARRATGAGSP